MKGTRVYPNAEGHLLLKEGEYGLRTDDTRKPGGVWYCRPPGSHMGSLMAHTVTEHEDGTITVSPSILITYGDAENAKFNWHGYLEKGVWRSC